MVVAAGPALFGQATTGALVGTVSDSSGATIPQAQILVKNLGTAIERRTVTNEAGQFTVPLLEIGTYSISVTKEGFREETKTDIVLNVDQTVRADFSLTVGSITELIEVHASAVSLDTDSATVGQVITEQQVEQLPLNGRSFIDLLFLSEGATQVPGEVSSSRAGEGNAISIAGGRPQSNGYLLDGVANVDTAYGTPAIVISVDAIQEFKEQQHNFSAEYGSSANQININTKSGTNAFHGTAFEFVRNNFWDARTIFDPSTLPEYRQNEFGYSWGGPVWIPKVYNGKNKTFFFANYEGNRVAQSSTSYETVPTTAELSGVFTSPIVDPLTGTPFSQDASGNYVIPASRFSRLAKFANTHDYWPAPNSTSVEGNYVASPGSPWNNNQQTYRIDENIGPRNSVFFRATLTDITTSAPNSNITPLGALITTESNHGYTGAYTKTFSPTLVNQARFGYLKSLYGIGGVIAPASALSTLGLTGLYPNLTGVAYPQIDLTGLAAGGGATNVPTTSLQTMFDFSDSLTWIKGAHTLTLGFGARDWHINTNFAYDLSGNFSFDGSWTGNSVADLLLGITSDSIACQPGPYATSGPPIYEWNYKVLAPFVQDDWKVTNRLTLNLGLRYEYFTTPFESKDREAWLDPNIPGGGFYVNDKSLVTNGIVGNYYQYSSSPGSAPHLSFGPRLGFAYRPFAGNATVVRGGYGIFYDSTETHEYDHAGEVYPYNTVGAYYSGHGPTIASSTLYFTDNLFPPMSTPGAVTVANLTFAQLYPSPRMNPYMQEWSLSIQRQLGTKTLAEINYVGTKGTHLLSRDAGNAPSYYDPADPTPYTERVPFPNLGIVISAKYNTNSNYNALNMRLERHSGDVNLLAVYTWARGMDTKSDTTGVGSFDQAGWFSALDPHNRERDYGPSAFDATQRLALSFVYSLPIGKGKRFVSKLGRTTDSVLGGWQFNGIALFQTGFPASVGATDLDFINELYAQRANAIGNPFPSGFHKTIAEYMNTAAFSQPALGQLGTEGRDSFRGPGTTNIDLSLFKNIRLKEALQLQLRLESFNAINHTQWTTFDNYYSDPTFGVVNGVRPARINQIGVKIVF
jgi:hypothetical protein